MSVYSGPYDPGETAPPRASQFLEVVKVLTLCAPFICKLTNSEPTPPPPLL